MLPEIEHGRKEGARKNYSKPLQSPSNLQILAKSNHNSTSKGAQETCSSRVILPWHKARSRRIENESAGGEGKNRK